MGLALSGDPVLSEHYNKSKLELGLFELANSLGQSQLVEPAHASQMPCINIVDVRCICT